VDTLVSALPERAAEAAGIRKQGGSGRLQFLLGIASGIAAGAGAGLLLQPPPDGGGDGGPRNQARDLAARASGQIQDAAARARQAFAQGRDRAVEAARSTQHAAAAAATSAQSGVAAAGHTSVEAAGTATPAVTTPARGALDGLKARWRAAVSEGREASAETQEELRRRYLEYTKRT
jgi:hypothetical protein